MHTATAHLTILPGIDAITITSDRCFPRHAHDHFGIGRIVAGGHASWSALGPVEAVAGDLIAVNPEEMHDGSPLARRERSWHMLYIPASVIATLTGRIVATLELPFAATSNVSLGRCFNQTFSDLTATDCDAADEAVSLLLDSLFVEASKTESLNRAQHDRSTSIDRVLQRIHDAPDRPASLDELSHIAGLDRFSLLRRFAKEVGITPHAYTIQLRVRIARRAIMRGVPLAEAAVVAGFADQSHMTRAFTRQFGLPPGRYSVRQPEKARNIVQDSSGCR